MVHRFIRYLEGFLSKYSHRLHVDKLYRLRFIATLICLNFVALVSLLDIKLHIFFDPLKFLEKPAIDTRKTLILFYIPTGLEASYPPKSKLIPIPKKVYQISKGHPEDILRENAKLIIQELMYEPDSLRAKKVIQKNDIIKYIWVWDRTLIVHLNESEWNKIPLKNRRLIQNSIRKSVLKNLELKEVFWYAKL